MSRISIIVPIYNSIDTIHRFFDCILKQTHNNFEVIIIDDGSTDGSEIVCDRYCRPNKKFKVIHTINNGPSEARNIGIIHATGEYVAFVDSDDLIDSDYLRLLDDNHCDLVVCKRIKHHKHIFEKKINDSFTHITMHNPLPYSKIYREYDMFSPFNKLFKRNILNKYNIRFPTNLSYGEDAIFVSEYLLHVKDLTFLDYHGYHYYLKESGSLSTMLRSNIINELIVSREMCLKNILLIEEEEDKEAFKSFIINEIYQGIAIFYSRVFYSKLPNNNKKNLLKNYRKNNYYLKLVNKRKSFFEGIMRIVVKYKSITFQLVAFRLLYCLKVFVKKK